MGCGASAILPDPVAVQEPGLCVFGRRELITDAPTTLILKENLWNMQGEQFEIKDTKGKAWFECKGAAFDSRDTKTLCDASGSPIFVMKAKILSLHKGKNIFFADGTTKLFDICTKNLVSVQSHLQATVANTLTGNKLRVTLEGTWKGADACIYLGESDKGGQPVARVSRRAYDTIQTQGESQQYCVQIARGADMALVVAMVLAWDEEKSERK